MTPSRRSVITGIAAATCSASMPLAGLAAIDPVAAWEQQDKHWREYPLKFVKAYRGYLDAGLSEDRAFELADLDFPGPRSDPRSAEEKIHPNQRMYGYWLSKGKHPSKAMAAKYARCHDKTLVDALANANKEIGGGMKFVLTGV